jgi:uncharacterized protein YjbJ (UPF0337 family)
MDENRLSGTAKNLSGKVEEFVGNATGDAKAQTEGRLNQVAGSAQDLYGQARDAASDAVDAVRRQAYTVDEVLQDTIETRPYLSVALALGVGLALGVAIARSR